MGYRVPAKAPESYGQFNSEEGDCGRRDGVNSHLQFP